METHGHETFDISELLDRAGLTRGQIDALQRTGYFMQPASKGHHLAHPGGLAEHSANVAARLAQITMSLGVRWPRPESPYIVGTLHDLVKCTCYRLVSGEHEEPKYEYVQPPYPGHGACSVAIAAELCIGLMREEAVAITYHMGVFGVGKEYTEREFNAALDVFAPQIIATCCADWYAARCDEECEVAV